MAHQPIPDSALSFPVHWQSPQLYALFNGVGRTLVSSELTRVGGASRLTPIPGTYKGRATLAFARNSTQFFVHLLDGWRGRGRFGDQSGAWVVQPFELWGRAELELGQPTLGEKHVQQRRTGFKTSAAAGSIGMKWSRVPATNGHKKLVNSLSIVAV